MQFLQLPLQATAAVEMAFSGTKVLFFFSPGVFAILLANGASLQGVVLKEEE